MPDQPPSAVAATLARLAATVRLASAVAAALGATATGLGLPATSVEITNYVDDQPAAGAAFVAADGSTPLPAGTSAEGDGARVALGYFTGATSSANFSGRWVPLTGAGSGNSGLAPVSIGDTNSPDAGLAGYITALLTFDAGSVNYSTFQNTPPAGTRLSILVYDGTTVENSTHFTMATNEAWRWHAPASTPAAPIQVDLNDTGTVWYGGTPYARRTGHAISSFPGNVPAGRLVNLSTRGYVGTGDAILIPGFVLQGSDMAQVLVRAVGPGLTDLGVPEAITIGDPLLTLNGITNNDWHLAGNAADIISATDQLGGFPLLPGSKDAAVLTSLSPQGYTVKIAGADGGTGIGMAEVYLADHEEPTAPTLTNLSTRGYVASGDAVMIAGFVVGSGAPQRLLIRAAGPALAGGEFNITGTLQRPRLDIFSSLGGPPLTSNDQWQKDGEGPRIAAAGQRVGAFPLNEASYDAAILFVAEPGGYTAKVSGVDGGAGIVVVEIYEIP